MCGGSGGGGERRSIELENDKRTEMAAIARAARTNRLSRLENRDWEGRKEQIGTQGTHTSPKGTNLPPFAERRNLWRAVGGKQKKRLINE